MASTLTSCTTSGIHGNRSGYPVGLLIGDKSQNGSFQIADMQHTVSWILRLEKYEGPALLILAPDTPEQLGMQGLHSTFVACFWANQEQSQQLSTIRRFTTER